MGDEFISCYPMPKYEGITFRKERENPPQLANLAPHLQSAFIWLRSDGNIGITRTECKTNPGSFLSSCPKESLHLFVGGALLGVVRYDTEGMVPRQNSHQN